MLPRHWEKRKNRTAGGSGEHPPIRFKLNPVQIIILCICGLAFICSVIFMIDSNQKNQSSEKVEDLYYDLALSYFYGHGAEIDDVKAFEYFERASKRNPDAKAYVGYYYYSGWGGVETDNEKATKLFRQSQKNGSAISLYFQAVRCFDESRLDKDKIDESIELCEKAIASGYAGAYGLLGLCYLYADPPKQDIGKAYSSFVEGERMGDDGYALYGLGLFYQEGYLEQIDIDVTRAVEYYEKASNIGIPDAGYSLGKYHYDNGDYSEARLWFTKAASRNNSNSTWYLGVIYEFGYEVSANIWEAVYWYRKGSDLGNAYTQTNLGFLYYDGTRIAQDYETAVNLFTLAAEQGHARAQNYLGICYKNGYGVEGPNLDEAKKWYVMAADQGDLYAQNNLGWLLYGSGEYTEAFDLFKAAANRGYANSQYAMGECFYYGRGPARNYSQAKLWYEKAAEQNYATAIARIGDLYYFGFDVDQDYEKAAAWFQRAADLGSAYAQMSLAYCYESGQVAGKDKRAAFDSFLIAAEQNDATAQYKVGMAYYYGGLVDGIDQDGVAAFTWFLKAAEQNDGKALYKIGQCYEHGWGVAVDIDAAEVYYSLALEYGYSE